MSHHHFLELVIQARYYSDRCKERGLIVPPALSAGDFENLTTFSQYWNEAAKLQVGNEEYLDLIVEHCARNKKRPPRHVRLSEKWVVDMVKKAICDNVVKRSTEIKNNQIFSEHTDEMSMIRQLERFDQLLRRSYEHMAMKAFKPNGWKLIFTECKGKCFAKSLAERQLVPEVFKHLSSSWRIKIPDDIPDLNVPKAVVQRFNELFPGDLFS
jgi:hypothetical protein